MNGKVSGSDGNSSGTTRTIAINANRMRDRMSSSISMVDNGLVVRAVTVQSIGGAKVAEYVEVPCGAKHLLAKYFKLGHLSPVVLTCCNCISHLINYAFI